MGKVVERIVNADRVEDLIAVFGSFDENVRRIEDALSVHIVNRGTDLKVSGDEEMVDKAVRTLEGLLALAAKGETIDEQRVRYLITLVNEGNDHQVAQMAKDVVCITAKGKPIKAKTVGQQHYMKAIQKNTITIGVGPAGTGKTYLAVAAAVAAFRERTVNRIILTRPAVEAGERLGFLPCRIRLTPTCVRCMTRCMICWVPKPSRSIRSGDPSKLPLWPICAAVPWMTASLSWTKPRTLPVSR